MRKLIGVMTALAAIGCGSQNNNPTNEDVVEVDECPVAGAYGCRGDKRIVCADGDGHRVWVEVAQCSNGCSNGQCAPGNTCTDECPGESVTGCSGDKLMICLTGDGCRIWVTADTCSHGCQDGKCAACVPDCTGRECGNDPVCGTSCGTCSGDATCVDGTCQGPCQPDCTGRECGNDPVCGTSCGTCADGKECKDGTCQIVQTECDYPASQGLSQPCCLKYGLDACGAGLFCAAFDGRTVPTCYVEHVRIGLQECGEDLHCANNSCNVETKKCRSIESEKCTGETGCAKLLGTSEIACDVFAENPVCVTTDGEIGSLCNIDETCNSGRCKDSACTKLPMPGEQCYGNGLCAVGYCDEGICSAKCRMDDSSYPETNRDFGYPCTKDSQCKSGICEFGQSFRGTGSGIEYADYGWCSSNCELSLCDTAGSGIRGACLREGFPCFRSCKSDSDCFCSENYTCRLSFEHDSKGCVPVSLLEFFPGD